MIAQAKWNVYDGCVVPEATVELDDGEYWENNEEDKEYAGYLFRDYFVLRRKVIEESGGGEVG